MCVYLPNAFQCIFCTIQQVTQEKHVKCSHWTDITCIYVVYTFSCVAYHASVWLCSGSRNVTKQKQKKDKHAT